MLRVRNPETTVRARQAEDELCLRRVDGQVSNDSNPVVQVSSNATRPLVHERSGAEAVEVHTARRQVNPEDVQSNVKSLRVRTVVNDKGSEDTKTGLQSFPALLEELASEGVSATRVIRQGVSVIHLLQWEPTDAESLFIDLQAGTALLQVSRDGVAAWIPRKDT